MKTNSGTGIDMTNHLRSAAVAVLLCSMAFPVRAQQFYLYEPKPVPSDTVVKAGDGVLVKEVPVQNGNTLYGISRKFTGHGMYYPQILLFNNIKDPNLIHVGDTLKIPLPKGDVSDVSPNRGTLKPEKKPAKAAKEVGKRSVKQSTVASGKVRPKVKAYLAEASSTDVPAVENRKAENRKSGRHVTGHKVAPAVDQSSLPVSGDVPGRHEKAAVAGSAAAADKKVSTVSSAGQQLYEKAVKAYKQEDFRTALDLFDRYLNDNPDSVLSADASLYKAECYLKLSAQ
jgi:LysM repeat protein